MLLHINKFIDRVRASENQATRQVVMSLSDARDLHADITRLLVLVQDLTERAQATTPASSSIQVDGGSF